MKRTIRIASTALVVAVVAALLAPSAALAGHRASLRVTTYYGFSSGAWSASGWNWSFSGSKSGTSASLYVRASKQSTSGNHPTESLSWSFSTFGNLSASDVSFASDLLPTSVNTGTDMGAYGSIKMTLKKATPLRKTVSRCKKTGAILATYTSRTGSFAGTFSFKPNVAGLPATVTKASIPVSVNKNVFTGKTCPGGGGSGCYPGSSFYGSQFAPTQWSTYASRRGTSANLSVSTGSYDSTDKVSISDSINAGVPATAVVISKTAVKLNGGSLAPLASGTINRSKASASTSTTKHCSTTTIDLNVDSGSITAHFALGDVVIDAFDSPTATIVKKI